MNTIDTAATTTSSEAAPDWARFLVNVGTTTTGEASEEVHHQEFGLQMKLSELASARPTLQQMAKLLVEFGATSVRIVPSVTDTINALCALDLNDGGAWTLSMCIPYSELRLLAMIQRLAGTDADWATDFEIDTPFTVSGRKRFDDRIGFLLTGFGDEALQQMQSALKSLASGG